MRGLAQILALSGLITLGSTPADAAPWTFDGEFGLAYDGNVSNAERSADRESAGVAVAGIRAEQRKPVNERDTLLLRGGVQTEVYENFDHLNNGKLTGLVRYMHRAGSTPRAPVVSLWGSAALWEFDSGLRDSAEYRGGLLLTKQLSEPLSGRFGVSASQREADSPVFDLASWSANIDLDWAINSALTLYGGTQFRNGDVVSTAPPSPALRDAADAREPDDVFPGRVAYRLDGSTWIHNLGFNYGLAPKLSLDVQAQYIDADAAAGNHYRRWITIASLLARF